MRGECWTGVGARFCCHGAGEGRRMMVWRLGGGELEALAESRYRQRQSRTTFSSDLPVRPVSARSSSSSLSVLSSSSSAPSLRIGCAFWYRWSGTILVKKAVGVRCMYIGEGRAGSGA